MSETSKYQERCSRCGFDGQHLATEMPKVGPNASPHFAKIECGNCGRFMRWLPKPETDSTKYRRPNQHRDLVGRFSRGFCELCLRKEGELGPRETLDGHHVIEYQDDGEPARENVWILCTACHKLVYWVRRYHGKHSPNEKDKDVA